MKRIILILSMILLGMTTSGNNIKETQDQSGESYLSMSSDSTNIQIPDWETGIEDPESRYGESISSGDLNGDGFDDVGVGAPAYDSVGAVFIYYGSSSGPSIVPDKIINGSGIGFGVSISCEGDVNNDGYYDLIIGDTYDGGHVYSYHGSATGIKDTADWISNSYGSGNFGSDVSSGGDVNGDGYDDLMASVHDYIIDSLHIGALVFLGSADGITDSAGPAWTASSPYSPGGNFGLYVSITGDVNGDGFDDAAMSSSKSGFAANDTGRVLLFYGSSDRQMFDPANMILVQDIFSENFGLKLSIVKDVNGDGFDELAVNYYFIINANTNIYYGSSNGPSRFNYFQILGSRLSLEPLDINTAGDFNNDGYNDLLYHKFTANEIYVFFGTADGISDILDTLHGWIGNLASGDINGDGISDALVSGILNQQKALGFFGSSDYSIPNILTLTPPQNAVSVNRSSDIFVVFDQDMDVSTINNSNIKVYGYETGAMECAISYDLSLKKITIDPDSNFKTGEKINVTLTSGIRSLENIPLKPFTWTFNAQALSGTGMFTETVIIDSTGSGGGDQITSGDFNGDGFPDIAQMNQSPEVFIYFNDGNANFYIAQIIKKSFNLSTGGSIVCGDFDNDNDLDLFLSFIGAQDSIYIYKNNGSGIFTQSFSANYNSGYRRSPIVNDFDSDGDLDIVSINTNWQLNLFLNDGIGNLTHSYINMNADIVEGVSSGDIDNDGDMDLITSVHNMSDCFNIILINNGNAVFIPGNIYHSIVNQANCPNADLDSDGDIDFVTHKKIFLNDGNGNFASTDFPVGIDVSEILPADYDADNDVDNVYIDYSSDVKVFKNNGSGSFTNFQNIQTGYAPNFGSSSDLDCDGDIDLIIESEGGHFSRADISILLNNYNCGTQFSITGSTTIPVGSENNVYVSSADSGYWNISNYDSTHATIPPNSENDTVLVSAGDRLGHFVLYYTAHRECGFDTLLSYHVYVDYPAPVELAAFTSFVNVRDVTLNWSTSSENNNSGFEIERAVDNGQKIIDNGQLIIDSWDKVGFVEGNGTVSEPRDYTFTDKNLQTGNYKYRLRQIDYNGNFEYFELEGSVSIGIPDKFSLAQNYPNPFNPVTNLEFGISELGLITLKVYDAIGREVASLVNEIKEPGYYTVKFNAANLASGVYFYRMTAGDFVAVKKFVVLK